MSPWLYSQMLALYPAEVRREYGREMRAQFLDDWREACRRGLLARLLFWFHIARDWGRTVASAHGEIVGGDLAAAWGNLRRRPWPVAAFVLLLAAVLSINSVGITLANRILLSALPFESRGSLVFLAEWREAGSLAWLPVSRAVADTLRLRSRTLTDIAFVGGDPQRVFVPPGVFDTLGMKPAAGRIYREDESDAVVIGPRLWQSRYRGSYAAIGQSIRLGTREYHIVGALAEQPFDPFGADIWAAPPPELAYGIVLARLRPGVSLQQAREEWDALRNGASGYWPAEIAPLRRVFRDPVFDYIAWGAAGAFFVVLLLACVSLMSLQLGQAVRRQRDIAIRLAMGASRARIVRFAVTETMAVTLLAGLLSLPSTALLIGAFHSGTDHWAAHRLAGWTSVRFDAATVALTFALCLFAGCLAGFVPAWKFASNDPWTMLNSGPLNAARVTGMLRSWLLSAQIALAGLILFAAVAFDREGVRRFHAPQVRYFDSTVSLELSDTARPVSVRNVVQRLEASGHRTIVTSARPFGQEPMAIGCEAGGKRYTVQMARVSAGFFNIPGFQWVTGRPWTESEATRADLPRVVIAEAFARDAGLKAGDSLVTLNPNGRRMTDRIAGIVRVPRLDMYGVWPRQLVFVPWQHGPLGGDSLLVEGKRAEVEAIVRAADPTLKTYVQDFAFRIRENGLVWIGIVATLWAAALMALSLALVGAATWMSQTFTEHGLEVALRCATGCRARGLWTWAARRVWRPLTLGAGAAVAGSALLMAIPSRLSPRGVLTPVAAGCIALSLLAIFWSLALWVGSLRAMSGPQSRRLRVDN
jgi:putative ABC transport system permease protein